MQINGKLTFDASSASTIENLRVQRYANVASFPAFQASDVGRLVYAITEQAVYYGDADSWMPLASGGSAFSQAEGDAIETTLGAAINTDGTLNAAAFNTPIVTAGSFTDAINQLAAYATGNNTLAELDDVALVSAAAGDYLRYNGTMWVDAVPVVADITELTVTAAQINNAAATTSSTAELNILDGALLDVAELNILDGATLTTTELNFVDGVTSSIQTQLNNKQPLDTGLTALAAFNTNGIIVQTANDVYAGRTLVAPAEGVTITDPAGILGNPTFALANDLAALEGLTGTGYIVRTGDGTAVNRSVAGNAGRIVVTNGDGVATNTDVDLATVTQGTSGTFSKVTLDAYGRVSGNTPVVQADITGLVSGVYVDVAGDTMTGNLVMGTGTKITLTDAPVSGTDAANKAYVDAQTQGLSWKNAVAAATTADGTLATAFAAGQVVDGVTLVLGDRILLKNQTASAENGIYVVTAGAPTRAIDMDAAAEFDGSAVFVKGGTINEGTGWTETLTVTTVDTSPVSFSQFSGGQAFIWGTGLANTGNTVFVNLGAGISELPSDEIGLDLVSNKAVQLTATTTGGQLTFLLDGAGLEQSSLGLKISANGVTNAMILNDTNTFNADTGSAVVDLGGTLIINGTSTQGISTAITGNTLTITAANASASQKGVATFQATEFVVTAGNVVLGTVANSNLANSTITITGTSGSDAVALGESLSFVGATSPITTSVAANAVTIAVAAATVSTLGLASFNTAHFAVTAGAVDLAATLDDLTNVSSADSATTGHVLVKGAGDWAPVSPATLAGTMLLGDLSDVGTAPATTSGQALIADGAAWQAKKIYHLETVGTAATTWTVTHALGQQYCNVTIVDATDNVVIPQSIVFTSTTVLTVTFNTAVAGKCVVMGIA